MDELDVEVRQECLRQAVAIFPSLNDGESVVEVAHNFYEFLTGERHE